MIRATGAEAATVAFRLVEGYRIAGHSFTSAENVLLRIAADDGHNGFGCAAPFEEVTGESVQAAHTALRDSLIPLVLEADLDSPATVMARAAAAAPRSPAALAAVDMALLDLLGKRRGLPLYRVLGAARERLATSVTLGIGDDAAATVERARRWVADGFRILKIKVGEDWRADADLMRALRQALGPGIVIRADANQGYSEADADSFLRAAAPWGLELLEQPVPAGQPDLLRRLRAVTAVPIMADESLQTEDDAARLAAAGTVDLFNVKLMKCGGVLAGLSIGRVATAGGIGVMVGCNDESRISIAAGLHLALAAPAATRADLDGHLDLQDDVARGGIRIRDGLIEPVDAPGLGVSVDF